MFSIGEISKKIGISPYTIRYYERISLLPRPARAENGYRTYSDADIERLRFVIQARKLGFSLDEIAEILAIRGRNEAPCRVVIDVIAGQVGKIDKQIADLRRLRHELVQLHRSGLTMPEGVEMKHCVCQMIKADQLE